jgi:CRP-like cAMP-binding protein
LFASFFLLLHLSSFFVTDSGALRATSEAEGATEVLSTADVFGELALMHDSATPSTVVALEPSVLWELHRGVFRHFLVSSTVRSIPLPSAAAAPRC